MPDAQLHCKGIVVAVETVRAAGAGHEHKLTNRKSQVKDFNFKFVSDVLSLWFTLIGHIIRDTLLGAELP